MAAGLVCYRFHDSDAVAAGLIWIETSRRIYGLMPSGEVEWQGEYSDGKKEGKWVRYDKNRAVLEHDIYENGVRVDS